MSIFRDHLLQRSHRRVPTNQLRSARLLHGLAFQPSGLVRSLRARTRRLASARRVSSRVNTSRKQGGLGKMNIPLLADKNMEIASKARRSAGARHACVLVVAKYGVLKDDEGIAFRGLFIIDPRGVLRQITINDLPVGRSVDETIRLVQAFQFTDKHGEGTRRVSSKVNHVARFLLALQCAQRTGNRERKRSTRTSPRPRNTSNTRTNQAPFSSFAFASRYFISSLLQRFNEQIHAA